jgi:hypothetical protein
MCKHQPPCPTATAPGRAAAHTVASHPDQGWSLLCNGVIVFEDTGELLPDGSTVSPHVPPAASSPRSEGARPVSAPRLGGPGFLLQRELAKDRCAAPPQVAVAAPAQHHRPYRRGIGA